MNDILVRKKDSSLEEYNVEKIISAINKAAEAVGHKLNDQTMSEIVAMVESELFTRSDNVVDVSVLHTLVISALAQKSEVVAKSYRDYRNWRVKSHEEEDEVYKECQKIQFLGDKSNSNADSTLVSTKRVKKLDVLSKYQYKKYFLNVAEKQAVSDGYIYVHDMSARQDTMNCCLFDVAEVLTGGFEMGNIWYNEPKTIDTAFDVVGDIVLMAASQQYGGFTLPEVDKILEPYAEKSYQKYKEAYAETVTDCEGVYSEEKAHIYAVKNTIRDIEQGYQGWEYKFNSVASSRGDYPFITISLGLRNTFWGREIAKVILNVRMNGQGKKDHKKPVLFPKIVFLYDENLHGPGKEMEDVFEAGVECSSKTMYPDWLSMTGEGYIASMYKKYGLAISPMGCRAFLSPWYEKGGMYPADETDRPVFVGRFNIGAVSLNLPMILAKSRRDSKDFYEVLDYYLEMIRNIHKRTYDYLGEMRASMNPLGFCEGGFYGGHLGLHDKIKPILKSSTASFGITALNELQMLYNGKSLVEDGEFALEVMRYINDKVAEFKKEDGNLYAIYGTPAESLCLAGDTEVQCYGGNKKIKDIKVGDLVYSYNESRKCIELKEVINHLLTKKNANVVKITLDNEKEIICTPNHPFAKRVMERDSSGRIIAREHIEYVEAQNLKKGDRLKSISDENHKVVSVEFISEQYDVYDITVKDNHNFFVGGDDAVLVHNCGLQVEQFRKEFGIVEGVSDREYVSNSFHCHVSEDITPIQKQDLEGRFWELFNGGKIQYVRYPIDYNYEAIRTLIRRAMKLGYYEGVNLSLAYCDDCGHQELEMDTCPVCGSSNLTKIDRMNGYLSFSRVHGDTRLNDAKMAEIAERKSM